MYIFSRGTTVNSNNYVNAYFCQVSPVREMSEMFWQHQATHKCVHQGSHKFWMNRISTSTLLFWHHMFLFLTVWSFERQPSVMPWGQCRFLCACGSVEEGEQLLPGGNTCLCYRLEEGCWQITVFSNTVVKLHEFWHIRLVDTLLQKIGDIISWLTYVLWILYMWHFWD